MCMCLFMKIRGEKKMMKIAIDIHWSGGHFFVAEG